MGLPPIIVQSRKDSHAYLDPLGLLCERPMNRPPLYERNASSPPTKLITQNWDHNELPFDSTP